MGNDYTMFTLLKDGAVVLVGDEGMCWQNCPSYHEDDDSWTIVYSDINEGPEVMLWETWEAKGSTWVIARGLRGLREALKEIA